MPWLRVVAAVGFLVVFGYTAATVQWTARLRVGNHTYFLDHGRHPVWGPPAPPGYERFRETFKQCPPGVIDVTFDPAAEVLVGLTRAWPVAVGCGLAYRAFRGPRRDPVLHALLPLAAGYAVAGVLFCCTVVPFGWPFGGDWEFVGLVLAAVGLGLGAYLHACTVGLNTPTDWPEQS